MADEFSGTQLPGGLVSSVQAGCHLMLPHTGWETCYTLATDGVTSEVGQWCNSPHFTHILQKNDHREDNKTFTFNCSDCLGPRNNLGGLKGKLPGDFC